MIHQHSQIEYNCTKPYMAFIISSAFFMGIGVKSLSSPSSNIVLPSSSMRQTKRPSNLTSCTIACIEWPEYCHHACKTKIVGASYAKLNGELHSKDMVLKALESSILNHIWDDRNIVQIHVRHHQEWNCWKILLMQLHALLSKSYINIIVCGSPIEMVQTSL